MARSRRYCPAGVPQHIVQRGNNRQRCFVDAQDKAVFCRYLTKNIAEFGVSLHAWVLMDNHFHLLATPGVEGAVSQMMQAQGRRYVRYFNHRYQRSGTLWEGRFRSCLIDSEGYLLACQKYIENNPVRARMVEHPGQFAWSSYLCHADLRVSEMHTPHPLYLGLGATAAMRSKAYSTLFFQNKSAELAEIRRAVQFGRVLGSERFKEHLLSKWGYSDVRSRRGRPPKK
jgi:putative transposase